MRQVYQPRYESLAAESKELAGAWSVAELHLPKEVDAALDEVWSVRAKVLTLAEEYFDNLDEPGTLPEARKAFFSKESSAEISAASKKVLDLIGPIARSEHPSMARRPIES